ncbi:MAG TPA: PepSY domain-containing protein [Sphingomicrobium sp.]|nr:PepSY domain-containing protein [Sphingomicrobium sp.]
MGAIRSRLRRWHVWLGWLVGLPFLFWTVSGLVMVAKPIEEVRGEHLIAKPDPVALGAPLVTPRIEGRSVAALTLEQRANGPRWEIEFVDGEKRLADPATGQLLPRLGAADAAKELMVRYTGEARVAEVTRVDADAPPLELRRAMDGWRVRMSDGTHFYIDGGSGDIVARRTRWWRFYDLMWGLHIMDLQGREDTSNPWVVSFAVLSLGMVLLAFVLLPMTILRRNRKASAPAE